MYIVDPQFTKLILEINEVRSRTAKIIVERDSLIYHICKNLKVDYMLKIGSLEYKLLKLQNEVLIAKRLLEILQEDLTNKKELNLEKAKEKVCIEFEEFKKIEKKMLEDIDISIDFSMSELIDEDNISKLNEIYLELQKRYNPILNLKIEDNDLELFKKIEKSYKVGNIKKLKSFLKESKENFIIDEIENLEKIKKRYEDIIKENNRIITKIKNTFPYNQKYLLENENLCRRKKNEINDLIYKHEIEFEKIKKEISSIVELKN